MGTCRGCGSELGPDGICARCLLARSLETEITVIENESEADEPGVAPDWPDADGDSFGPYRIVHPLGEGGMGAVYLARQIDPLRRDVALKVIKTGLNSAEILSRFSYELEALSLMDHPNIARVYYAGASKLGRPYFVMEYVDGLPVTEYCDRHKLNVKERVELFTLICEALQHAHQKGVIHRDIKPSNVLVAEWQGRPAPKVIDFGIARATEQRATQTAQFTHFGQVIGTPEYMSPEQADPIIADADTSSDVYSLGVLLYELLTGATPFNVQTMRSAGVLELLRIIREEDATPPSAKLTRMGEAAIHAAHNRNTDVATLRRVVKGDLTSIVMPAMAKDRRRRYPTAAELGADIGRYLRNEAVLATPPSAVYRARKFARRHRAALATLCAFMLLLMAAAAVSTWQSVVAKHQRDRADSEAAIAQAVNQFLAEDLLSQANPEAQDGVDTSPDPDVKAKTLLDRAAAKVEKRFGNQPLIESDIQHTIAKAYSGLGLNAEAERHMRKAYELSAAHRGADDPKTLDLLMALSGTLIIEGKNPEAVSAAKAVFLAETRTLGPENPRTVVATQNLGSLYFSNNQYADAEPLLIKALALQSRSLGYDNIDTLNTSDTLVALYIAESKYAQARALLEKGLDSYRRMYGPEHPFTGREMFGLAKVLFGEGNYPQAENLLEQLQALYVRVYGPRHPNLFYVQSILGQTYVEEGKCSQGISLLQKTIENLRPVDPREALKAEVALGWAYDATGSLAAAERIWDQALSGYRNLGKDDEMRAADVAELLGQNLSKQRKYQQAEPLLRQALAIREKSDLGD